MQASIFVTDDEPALRNAIVKRLSRRQHRVRAFQSGDELLAAVEQDLPDLILLDLKMPGMTGIEGIAVLRKQRPETALVVLTVYEDNDRVFEALCAGATGYLLKNTLPAKLLEGIQEAVRGGSPMSPGIARQVVELFRRFRPPDRSNCDLTNHEVRLLKLLVDGHSYKTAAVSLSVTVNTVAFHIKSIYGKLQVHSKSEAVARALRDNLLS